MILTCPECSARYRLADGAIPAAGRSVQCASCKHSWFEAGSDGPPPAAAPEPARTIERVRAPLQFEPPRPPAAPASATVARTAWWPTLGALVIGAVLTILAASVWRFDPQQLGLDLPDDARNPAAIMAQTPLLISAKVELSILPNGGNFVAVSGTITNPTKTAQPVVDLIADVHDRTGRVIDSWTIPAPVRMLPAGRAVAFDSAASNIPAAAASLSVHFPGIKPKL
ncbi:MAG: zinc-ribbon domain-containing protein [Polymorphobacter sp.]